jgi:chemotaxis protein methyltransferase CheR
MFSNQQFDRTQRLALSLAGIELVERHRELLRRRIQRLGIVDSNGVDALLIAAEQGDAKARRQLLSLLTTKFTGFFRHSTHFNIAAEHALRAARYRGLARIWSAGAASGEEPYSIAMRLMEMDAGDDPPVAILATDVDMDALSVGERGEYAEAALRSLEPARRERFLKEIKATRRWAVADAVRNLVEFRVLNLADVAWSLEGPFDVIFCRNVLMYLEARLRVGVLERMASLLTPDGLLMLDPTEHLGPAEALFSSSANGVFAPTASCSRDRLDELAFRSRGKSRTAGVGCG